MLRGLAFLALAALSACGERVYDTIELMPSPEAYRAGVIAPYDGLNAQTYATQRRLFYVTDRRPAVEGDKPAFYANDRGFVLRAGVAKVAIDPPLPDAETAIAVTTAANRDARYKLSIAEVEEFGVIPVSASSHVPGAPPRSEQTANGRAFLREVNRNLSAGVGRDIYVYIHGYNVDFDYPVLTSRELQHFLGYKGAFITYAWPSTPNGLAYFKDLETADATRRNLREFLTYLSEGTSARRIHLIGYSAGSRLTFETLYDIALRHPGGRGAPRLGQVALISSDVDRTYFGEALSDGLLDVADDVSIYMSATDTALGTSSRLLGRPRLGQAWEDGEFSPAFEARIASLDRLHLIDVTEAEDANSGNGHHYFRTSPWASTDLFMMLLSGRDPGQRGLVRAEGAAVWEFPTDYPDRIRKLGVAR